MNRFCVRALAAGEMNATVQHLAGCETCHQQFILMLRSRRSSAPLKFTLAPEYWFRHEHLDYEQLVGLADNALDATIREIIDIHLKVCASCTEDVRSFLAFREQMDQEPGASIASAVHRQRGAFAPSRWWHTLAWKPIYAAALIVLGIALVIGAAFFVKRRADNFQAKQNEPTQVNIGTPSETPPSSSTANSASIPPSESPQSTSSNPSLTVEKRRTINEPAKTNHSLTLNDGHGTVTIDRVGRVFGLEEVPENRRREIVAALVEQRIGSPPITNQLSPPEGTLRGSASGQPFRLLYPARTVIISDQPLFQWEPLAGATAYQVLVGDSSGREVARSEALPPTRTAWMPPGQLQRGEIYSWIVTAIIDGKEVASPSPSASEMKFQILSTTKLEELNQLKLIRSHLAWGIFCASVGLNSEAQQEFRELVRLNPRSKAARELLNSVAGAKH